MGLTGGIGTGKSLVAEGFARRGVPIVDADQIARTLVQPGTSALESIVAHFGSEVLTPAGELDRNRLRTIIYQDPTARLALEAILHPPIYAQMRGARTQLSAAYALLVIPLLVETQPVSLVDRILVVHASRSVQIQRVQLRDTLEAGQIEAILAAQCSSAVRLSHADDIIYNEGDVSELDAQIELLHQRYLSLAASAVAPH